MNNKDNTNNKYNSFLINTGVRSLGFFGKLAASLDLDRPELYHDFFQKYNSEEWFNDAMAILIKNKPEGRKSQDSLVRRIEHISSHTWASRALGYVANDMENKVPISMLSDYSYYAKDLDAALEISKKYSNAPSIAEKIGDYFLNAPDKSSFTNGGLNPKQILSSPPVVDLLGDFSSPEAIDVNLDLLITFFGKYGLNEEGGLTGLGTRVVEDIKDNTVGINETLSRENAFFGGLFDRSEVTNAYKKVLNPKQILLSLPVVDLLSKFSSPDAIDVNLDLLITFFGKYGLNEEGGLTGLGNRVVDDINNNAGGINDNAAGINKTLSREIDFFDGMLKRHKYASVYKTGLNSKQILLSEPVVNVLSNIPSLYDILDPELLISFFGNYGLGKDKKITDLGDVVVDALTSNAAVINETLSQQNLLKGEYSATEAALRIIFVTATDTNDELLGSKHYVSGVSKIIKLANDYEFTIELYGAFLESRYEISKPLSFRNSPLAIRLERLKKVVGAFEEYTNEIEQFEKEDVRLNVIKSIFYITGSSKNSVFEHLELFKKYKNVNGGEKLVQQWSTESLEYLEGHPFNELFTMYAGLKINPIAVAIEKIGRGNKTVEETCKKFVRDNIHTVYARFDGNNKGLKYLEDNLTSISDDALLLLATSSESNLEDNLNLVDLAKAHHLYLSQQEDLIKTALTYTNLSISLYRMVKDNFIKDRYFSSVLKDFNNPEVKSALDNLDTLGLIGYVAEITRSVGSVSGVLNLTNQERLPELLSMSAEIPRVEDIKTKLLEIGMSLGQSSMEAVRTTLKRNMYNQEIVDALLNPSFSSNNKKVDDFNKTYYKKVINT